MRYFLSPLCFILTFFSTTPTLHIPQGTLNVVWNVGQGQWITAIRGNICWHFDVGGEFLPSHQVLRWCQHRENRILLSHWDWDHIGFLAKPLLKKLSPCLFLKPLGNSSQRKQRLLQNFPLCPSEKITALKTWSPQKFKTSNDSSHVILWEDLLIPGDSSLKMESLWQSTLNLQQVSTLVLGHHGSRTSTGSTLLKKLPRTRMAISSAREKKHGHPHPQVQARLQQHRISLIKTADWGHIWWSAPGPLASP